MENGAIFDFRFSIFDSNRQSKIGNRKSDGDIIAKRNSGSPKIDRSYNT